MCLKHDIPSPYAFAFHSVLNCVVLCSSVLWAGSPSSVALLPFLVMPTDVTAATLTPPVDEHENPLAGRSICPPEELRIHPSRTVTAAPSSHDAIDDDASIDAPTQQPTPPPTDDLASLSRTPSSPDPHPKPIESSVDRLIRDIPTPMSTADDSAEEQRHAHASPLSALAPLTASWSQQKYPAAPCPSHRVCINAPSQRGIRVGCRSPYRSFFPIHRRRSSAPAVASKETRLQTGNSTKSK